MAAHLTDRQKKLIIADYAENRSYNAIGKKHGVAPNTVKKIVRENADIAELCEEKKRENTEDILAYMESKKSLVCEIIGKGLEALSSPEKLATANPAQITTALGTLIDKWTAIGGSPGDSAKEDELSQSLRELGERLESDDKH